MLARALLEQTGISSQKAHATAILVILPVSILTFILYAIRGIYDFSVLIPTALGVTVGGFLGAKLLGKLPAKNRGDRLCRVAGARGRVDVRLRITPFFVAFLRLTSFFRFTICRVFPNPRKVKGGTASRKKGGSGSRFPLFPFQKN